MSRRKAPVDEPLVDAVAVRRKGLGHEVVYLRIPESAVRLGAVRTDAPELKSIIAERMVRWISDLP